MLSVLAIAMIIVLLFHRHRHHKDHPQDPTGQASESKTKKQQQPRFPIGIGSSEGGVFWTGAMRCPKCRADMEQIVYEGTEIDRCTICKGIWFDAGEIDVLKNKQAAKEIDIGDEIVGKQANTMDNYQCPRCSGAMVKVIDPNQTHIWYETCSSCHGSYLDAGELKDLANITISDFFKNLAAPERR